MTGAIAGGVGYRAPGAKEIGQEEERAPEEHRHDQKALRRREKAGKVERPGARPRRPAHGEDEGGVGDRPDRQRGPRDAGSVHGPAV